MRTMDWTILLMEIKSKFYTSIHSFVFFFPFPVNFNLISSKDSTLVLITAEWHLMLRFLCTLWSGRAAEQQVARGGGAASGRDRRDTDPVNNLNDPATSNYIFNDPQLHLNTNWDVFSPSRVCGWNSEPVPLEAALCLRCSSSSLLTLLVSSKQFLLQLSPCKHLTYISISQFLLSFEHGFVCVHGV